MGEELGVRDWDLWSTSARLLVTRPGVVEQAGRLLDDWLQRVDEAANRFRADSEIATLRPGEWNEISPTLATLLDRAVVAAGMTSGFVDPTVGDALNDLGYDRDLELVVADGRPVRGVVRPVPGWRRIRLDGRRVWIPGGVHLDLGATAKAVAAEVGATILSERFDTGALVSLGGDVAVAGSPPPGGWRIAVEDHGDRPLGSVNLYEGAVATSSTVKRSWMAGEEIVHHIVDPRTGRAAESPYRTVTVVSRSCLRANAFATATIARADDAITWLESRGVVARLVRHDGEVVSTRAWSMGEAA